MLNELRVSFPSPTAQSKKNKQEDTFPRKSLVVKQTKNEKQKKDLNNKAISTCEEETIPSCEEETQSTVVKTGSVRASWGSPGWISMGVWIQMYPLVAEFGMLRLYGVLLVFAHGQLRGLARLESTQVSSQRVSSSQVGVVFVVHGEFLP